MLHKIWQTMGGDHARFFPDSSSTMANSLNGLALYLLIFSLLFTVAIFACMIAFCIRYRRRTADQLAFEVRDNTRLEIVWTVLPFLCLLVAFFCGTRQYLEFSSPLEGESIYVFAKQWMWKFEHENGLSEINELHVPAGKDIRLVMISQDVIHSLFIPEYRMKFDVLPGRYTRAWFRAERAGSSHLFCSQYCGTDHSKMTGAIYAMTPSDFEAWEKGMRAPVHLSQTSPERGRALFVRENCEGCHTDSGHLAPRLEGLFRSRVLIENGESVFADETYLRRSIVDPGYEIVRGYQAIMPTYAGLLSEDELVDLIHYIESLKNPEVSRNE